MKRICFVGASTTEGQGDAQGLGWAGRLVARLHPEPTSGASPRPAVYNLGVRGQALAQIAARAPGECAARLPRGREGRIVLSPGVNDLAFIDEDGARVPRTPWPQTLETFEGLVEALSAIAPLLVVGPAPVDEALMPFRSVVSGLCLHFTNARIAEADAAYARVCMSRGVPYVSVLEALLADTAYCGDLSAGDGLHPAAPGYGAQAERLAADRAVREHLG